jgi:2-oxoglutarate ferredoxin oxidoreductase subunit beta
MLTDNMQIVYEKPETITNTVSHYCPGCTHGVIHRLIAEVIDELDIREKTVGIAPVGCSVFAYNYFDLDFAEAAHGRAPAMATGLKRVHPECTVFAYQGDGDLAAIGTAEIVHVAARGENISVFFVNNAVYGMTSGQMAPTTLPGMRTTTTPTGRDVEIAGYPIRVCELLAQLSGASYVVRRSVHDPGNINKTKKAIRNAFQVQLNQAGFSLVEILSSCPTNWGLSTLDALKFVKEQMIPYYPLGDYKVADSVKSLVAT